MRHHKKGRAFARVDKGRIALLRGLVISLIEKERVHTTEAKAKEIRPIVEKIVTKSRTDNQATRKLVASKLFNNKRVVSKLFNTLAPRYKERAGGYLRITKMVPRKSDGSKMAVIEFV